MKRVQPKVPKVPEESFFASCRRDKQGHCMAGSGGLGTQDKVTKRGVTGQSRPAKKDKTEDKVEGTEYTVAELEDAARRAGKELFGKHRSGLVLDPITRVDHYNLSELQKPDEESGSEDHVLDEYEYVFFPSTGKGKDVASQGWGQADQSWKDKDGNIYTVSGTGILTVVKADTKVPKKYQLPEAPQKVGIKEDPDIKVGKFHMGQHVEINRPGWWGHGRPGAQIAGFADGMYRVKWPDGAGALLPAKVVKKP